jgi:hypothetical protein
MSSTEFPSLDQSLKSLRAAGIVTAPGGLA